MFSHKAGQSPAPIFMTLIILLVLAVGLAGPASAVPMGDLHCNDATGLPLSPYTIGTPVTVTGIVTAPTGAYSATFTDVFLQDATGAMEVYNAALPATFALGDSFTVNGTITQYRGNTQITMTSATKLGTGLPVPNPLVLTCLAATNSFGANNCEPNESRLIRINHVTYSGTWGAGATLTLTDSTGTFVLYIDADTGVQTAPPPPGYFDVIGVLKQYDTTSPYTTGYEILPRRPADIVLPGPGIVSGPTETNIQATQVTITWTTDRPGSTRVDYGLTPSHEMGFVQDPSLVTQHAIVVPDLTPATIYHYSATSQDAQGTTETGDKVFCSASGSEVSGQILVFFNKSIDPTLALGVTAQGNVNLQTKLLDRITAAQYSIDVCLYSFDLPTLADNLIAARDRGVKVRFITTVRSPRQTQVQRLIDNGIQVIDAGFGNNDGSELMHNKFWIFDHRGGSPDGSDDWVYTGSHNATSEGTYTDAQNVIEVQDAALATAYTAEFEEMWGSSTDLPDPNTAKFGIRKTDNTPKRFDVHGVPMMLYFSPSDNSIGAAVQQVQQAETSVHFCILSYTRADLAAAMQYKWYNSPGFELRGVFDSAEQGNSSSQYSNMKGTSATPWNPPADVWLDTETGALHHKYMIIDVNRVGQDPTVITGSTNWSNAGNNDNDENMLIVQDFSVANQYFQEFSRRYHNAGGTGDLTVGAPAFSPRTSSWALWATPNPSAGSLVLRYDVPVAAPGRITLYTADGRLEEVLFHGQLTPGDHQVKLDQEASGAALPSGVHFVKLEANGQQAVTRILVIR